MCGICGKFVFKPGVSVPLQLIQDMATMLAHRGPNGEGFHVEGPVGLGHRRLSIIDLAGGGQPIANEDGTVWIVFNGEIYNHEAVRRELEAKGHRYNTRSDTETIVHAYEEYGPDCLKRLKGMFAFAIWDARDRSLFAARDRFGIKPFYYAYDSGAFSFASEVKALLIDPECDDALDPIGVYDYFTSFVFGTNTMFRAIKRLAPAHWLRVRDGRLEIQRYWHPEIDPALAARPEGENLERLEALLREVVRDHLMSEVPQGTFLSGGVDSSLITLVMSRLIEEPVRTFTISFPGHKGFDESDYARQVAEACGSRHHVFECAPDRISLLPKVLWHLEEPLADAPTIALFILCQEAAKEVTVVHCGDGGDEGFGGYTRFYWDQYAAFYNRLPAFVRRDILNPIYRAMQFFPDPIRDVGRRGEKFTRYSALNPAARYMTWFSNTPDDVKHQMLEPGFLDAVGSHRSVETFETLFAEAHELGLDELGVRQYHDLYNFIPHSLMLKGDKIAMAAGIEGRFPWLDDRLVNFGLSLPPDQKMTLTQIKLAPRRILARYMPKDFVWRRKRGFGVPIEAWFKSSLKDSLRENIRAEATRGDGILNSRYLEDLAARLHGGDPHVWPYLWCAYVFQEWRKVYSRPRAVCREALASSADPLTRARGTLAPLAPSRRGALGGIDQERGGHHGD